MKKTLTFVVLAVLSSTATADVKSGKYTRTGGWSAFSDKTVKSCGPEMVKSMSKPADAVTDAKVTADTIQFNSGRPLPIHYRDAELVATSLLISGDAAGRLVMTFGVGSSDQTGPVLMIGVTSFKGENVECANMIWAPAKI